MEYILSLKPQYLGRRLQERIRKTLHKEVEGKYFSGIGYVILVDSIAPNIGFGLVDPNNGYVEFRVKYIALIYAPVLEEVTFGIVKKITEVLLNSL